MNGTYPGELSPCKPFKSCNLNLYTSECRFKSVTAWCLHTVPRVKGDALWTALSLLHNRLADLPSKQKMATNQPTHLIFKQSSPNLVCWLRNCHRFQIFNQISPPSISRVVMWAQHFQKSSVGPFWEEGQGHQGLLSTISGRSDILSEERAPNQTSDCVRSALHLIRWACQPTNKT